MLIKYSNKELDLCARLMRAEALAEGDLAMLMVGNVIVNRAIANCLDFKNIRTITDVVYQKPGGFVGTNLVIQTNQIMAGYTTKQIASIKREVYQRNKNSEERIDDKFFQDNSKREKLSNLIRFLCQKQEPSLIIPERDL